MHNSIVTAAGLAAAMALAALAGASSAQQPGSEASSKREKADSFWSVPHLKQNRLDMSFCRYPDAAWRANLEGCCRMRVQVAADGAARVLDGQCTDDVFLAPSRSCLSPQSYWPARKNGRTVKGTGEVVVNYVMPQDDASLVEIVIAGMFGKKPQAKLVRPNDDFCAKRPGDMISSLRQTQG